MTEDDLIAAIRRAVEADAAGPGPRPIVLGIGDDAAAWRPSRSHLSVISTDALVDGVHFLSASMDPAAIGHRAVAANLSDIAAMGARPVLVTVALGVTPEATEAWVLACYRGMAALAARFGSRIVGGDVVRSPAISLTLTIVGEVSPQRLKRRSAGRPGDVVAVTGALGASRAGLALALDPSLAVPDPIRARASAAFATPEPRVAEGRWLAASVHVRAMMDSSDGLATDLGRLARAAGCGAEIDALPIDPAARAVAEACGASAEAYALGGGEDFELIATIAPRAFAHLAHRFQLRFGKPLLPVGRLAREPGVRDAAGVPIAASGYEHLG